MSRTLQEYILSGMYSQEHLNFLEKGIQAGIDEAIYEDNRFPIQLVEMLYNSAVNKDKDVYLCNWHVTQLLEQLQIIPKYAVDILKEVVNGNIDNCLQYGVTFPVYNTIRTYCDKSYIIPYLLINGMNSIKMKIVIQEGNYAIKHCLTSYYYCDERFDAAQFEQITAGIIAGADINVFAKPEITANRMREFIYAHNNKVDASSYIDYQSDCMREITNGVLSGVNTTVYTHPYFVAGQMYALRVAMENNIDVSTFARPDLDGNQMLECMWGKISGIDISFYCSNTLSAHEMKQIRYDLENQAGVPHPDKCYT